MKLKKIYQLILLVFASNLSFGQSEDLTKYLPEVRAINKVAAALPQFDLSTPEKIAKSRTLFYTPVKTVLTPQNRVVQNISIRIFRPDTMRAVVMDIHGGGFCVGSAKEDDQQNDVLARTCKVAVVSIDYRLSPENPYPAQVDDCETILTWLLKNSKSEFGVEKIIISGESAGSNLATLILIRLRDKQVNIKNVVGLNLFYGGYDLSGTPSSRQYDSNAIFISKRVLNQFFEKTFPNKSLEQLRDPTISPLFANLNALPPALFSVGDLDPLLDDSKFMASRWESTGNQTILKIYPECPHAFNKLPTQMANVANNNVYKWINNLLR
jgi:acetyl esterase